MSRILYLCQLLPYPLDAGPKTRAYYVLRQLAQKHDVTLVCFVRPGDSPEAVEHIHQVCRRLVTVQMVRSRWRDGLALAKSLLSGRSWIIERDGRRQMRGLIGDLMQKEVFDFIHADQLWMAQYALLARKAARGRYRPKLVLDQHNAVFMIPQRMAENTSNSLIRGLMKLEAQRLARYEVETCQQFNQVIWVSQEDWQAVRGSPAAVSWEQNVKHTDRIIPICVDPAAIQPNLAPPREPRVLFVGGFHWPPNVQGVRWFIQEVWPRVRAQLPEARFTAVGKLPPGDFELAEGVSAPGYVENLEPYYRESRAFVVPLLAGGGMRVKILDAWMYGVPVVSTRIGAEGIVYQDGAELVVADTAEVFAEQLVGILSRDEMCSELGKRGRQAVEERYDWNEIYTGWDEIYIH